MDFNAIAEGLASHPTAWTAALLLGAVVYLFKALRERDQQAINTVIEQERAHRETLARVVPLAEKLTEGVQILERVSTRLAKEP